MARPITIKIDITKLQKEHFFKGAKGTYCTLEVWPRKDGADQYGNTHSVKQAMQKDASGNYPQGPFVGDAKFPHQEAAATRRPSTPPPAKPKPQDPDLDVPEDDIPF